MTPAAIVHKLWSCCTVLRDDGRSCGDDREQLTDLRVRKMADEQPKPPWAADPRPRRPLRGGPRLDHPPSRPRGAPPMTALRLARPVTDPSLDARQPIAALIAVHDGGVLVRAPGPGRPAAARAKVERVRRDLEGPVPLDPLPLGAGAQVVGGAVRAAPVSPGEVAAWARRALSDRAA